jgi:AcrR family transcriptional regulator
MSAQRRSAAGRSGSAARARARSSEADRPDTAANPTPRPPGRRPGESGTREAILAAGRAAFAEAGYDRATLRNIAARAGVDPALVLHYFRSKEGLFGAALELPVRPSEVIGRGLAAGREQLGATIVRAFLEAWEPTEQRVQLIAMLRSATTNETAMAMIRESLTREVFGPITQQLGLPDAQLRATLVGSQFVGLALLRYIGRLEPLASASIDELVAAIGPTVQRYLTGELSAE